jgi:hypothetical protein
VDWIKKHPGVLRGSVVLVACILLKRMLYDRYTAISHIEELIKTGQLRRVILGNLLVIGLFKNKSWYQAYTFGSMYPKNPIDIFNLSQKSKVSVVSGLFPTEGQLFQGIALSFSFYLTFLMIKTI